MDLAVHELDFAAQAHWHHFRYRIGEMIGLDRTKREVELAPYLNDEGGEVGPHEFPLRHADHRDRQPWQRLRHAGCSRACDLAGHARTRPNASMSGCSIPAPCAGAIRTAQTRATERGNHRRRRYRNRACGRAALRHAPARRLRSRSNRSREGHHNQPDRGRGSHPAPVSATTSDEALKILAVSVSGCIPRRASKRLPRVA